MSFQVITPGVLGLLQDAGRYGQHGIGLTTGGPADAWAFAICQRLLDNDPNATLLEIGFGGLELEARVATTLCLTGADMPLYINDKPCDSWCTHHVQQGDRIRTGYAQSGCRAYLGVAGGFLITPQFGSTATVVRESIGGLTGDKLTAGDILPCKQQPHNTLIRLADSDIPDYPQQLNLRLILGYQQDDFDPLQQQRFFSTEYEVTERSDRMGYCLQGTPIACNTSRLLSEGICLGAVQIPADGQPIVLLHDRQTIGGYPKIGSVLSLDCARLTQLRPGNTVTFESISPEDAHNALHLAARQLNNITLEQPK